MAIKKSELYSSLWESCHQLRGGMDASQYKDYVLVLLFVKYVSDKYAGRKDALLDVPTGGSFADMVALKGDKEIGDKMNKIIARLAEANDLKGVIDVADFNDADKLGKGKEMVDRLSRLVAIFAKPELDFSGNRAEGDDLLGDAYEYLMRHFATESGKSKGQFYTPAEVSRVMAKVIGVGDARSPAQTIHDPTCGSGSLLLKAHDEARGRTGLDLALYGQEMDNATKALARMNMILHDCPTAEIWQDNSLSTPHFKDADGRLKTFDFVVANPPFSTKAWSNGFNPAADEFHRFDHGIPPAKNGDYAFLLHILACLKSTGKGAVILPHGVLFRGGAEAVIRREIVRRGTIKGIIGLPANLFYGTGIPARIIVLDNDHAHARKGLFMIDASRGFLKDGNKNRLRLNLPRYIDSTEPEDLHDIDAHLRGGIPDRDIDGLDRDWQVFPSLRTLLFAPADRPGYKELAVPIGEVKAAILGHPEFTAFNDRVTALFARWRKSNTPRLRAIQPGGHPKALIEGLSEDLLDTFRRAPLLDPYDVYQHLMDRWDETMQDDVYQLVQDGWTAVQADGPDRGQPNTDLVPEPLIVARYFAREQAAVEKLEADRDAITRQMEEMDEEHGGEDGLLFEAKNDKGKLTRAGVTARLKEIMYDKEAADERQKLDTYLGLIDKEAAAGKRVKDARKTLDAQVAARYAKLTPDEVRTLVVDDKWRARLADDVQGELDRVSQSLTGRIRQLAQRYANPLPKLVRDVEALAARVDAHLARMGFRP